MAGLLAEIDEGGVATPEWPPFRAPTLGIPQLTIPRLLETLRDLPQPRKDPADEEAGRVLDTQIEAQVHGPIDLHQDVELLVADPAFAATDIGSTATATGPKRASGLRRPGVGPSMSGSRSGPRSPIAG